MINDDEFKLENLPELPEEFREICERIGKIPAGWLIAKGYEKKVEGLSKAIKKFLYDASFTPPWQSAGSKWLDIIRHLDRTHKEIMGNDSEIER